MHVPTRGDRALDLIITNMPQFSKEEFLQIFPPFGLSDHSVVLLEPILKSKRATSIRRLITRRDTGSSRKCELGRYLGSIDWSVLDSDTNCYADHYSIFSTLCMKLKATELAKFSLLWWKFSYVKSGVYKLTNSRSYQRYFLVSNEGARFLINLTAAAEISGDFHKYL